MKITETVLKNEIRKRLEEKKYLVSITNSTDGKYTGYDPIRQERIYVKPGSIIPMKFSSEQEAKEKILKILKKRYPKELFIFQN